MTKRNAEIDHVHPQTRGREHGAGNGVPHELPPVGVEPEPKLPQQHQRQDNTREARRDREAGKGRSEKIASVIEQCETTQDQKQRERLGVSRR